MGDCDDAYRISVARNFIHSEKRNVRFEFA